MLNVIITTFDEMRTQHEAYSPLNFSGCNLVEIKQELQEFLELKEDKNPSE